MNSNIKQQQKMLKRSKVFMNFVKVFLDFFKGPLRKPSCIKFSHNTS